MEKCAGPAAHRVTEVVASVRLPAPGRRRAGRMRRMHPVRRARRRSFGVPHRSRCRTRRAMTVRRIRA